MRARTRRWTRIGAYGLLVSDGRILLCRLSGRNSSPGYWTLPGGGVDFGEHPESAAAREVYEETGLRVKIGAVKDVASEAVQFEDSLMHAIQILYTATVISGELTHEVDGTTDLCEWVPLSGIEKLPLVSLARRGVVLVRESL